MKQILTIAGITIKALLRKKDFYVFFLLLALLLGALITQDIFGIQDVSRHIKDIGFYCLWLFSFIIATTFSAKQMPEEINSKTILPLLAKPVKRAHCILGRFLGSLLTGSFAFTIFYLLFLIFVFYKGEGISKLLIFQSYLLGVCFLGIVCAVSILLSLLFTLSTACTLAIILYLSVMLLTDTIRTLILTSKGFHEIVFTIFYYILPHYEFFDLRTRLVHSWDPLPIYITFMLVGYAILYISVILYISLLKFKRKIF